MKRGDPLVYYIMFTISSWLSIVQNGRPLSFFSPSRTATIDNTMSTDAFNPKSALEVDPWLEPFIGAIDNRYQLFKRWKDTIADTEGGYDKFTKGYLTFGLNVQPDNSVVYREWAPNAISAALTGDFSLSPAWSGVTPDTDAGVILT